MWREVKRCAILGLLLAVLSLCSLPGCRSGGLPQPARTALDESIAKLAGSVPDYKIVSAQPAPGTQEEINIDTSRSHEAGRCPPNWGGEETWCVVIDRSIANSEGHPVSHFLITRQGSSWDVEALTDSDAGVFEYFGCSNWDAAP